MDRRSSSLWVTEKFWLDGQDTFEICSFVEMVRINRVSHNIHPAIE